jgi:heme a synthase
MPADRFFLSVGFLLIVKYCFNMSWHKNYKSLFKKFCFFTIANIYFVILAGGVVRCTGSGMGCPDWPKCFGKLIPPTTIEDLPENYLELYSNGGKTNIDFNVYKTWTEYINRLIGALVGVFIFFTFLLSFSYKEDGAIVVVLSFLSFLFVGLQGWLGSKVVDSNLKPYMVTIHMLLALVIVAILIYVYAFVKSREEAIVPLKIPSMFLGLLCIMSLVQIILGTQVRQSIDVLAFLHNYINRNLWIGKLGNIFIVHRLFAYFVMAINGYLILLLGKNRFIFERNLVFLFLFCEVFSGFILTFYGLPSFIQPMHLVFASLLFGLQFYLLILSSLRNNVVSMS